MLLCSCKFSLQNWILPKSLAVKHYSTVWSSSSFNLTLHNDGGEQRTYKMDLGQAELPHSDPLNDAPSILAVHPSGSSYKQWSGLSSIAAPGAFSGLYGINMFGYGLSDKWDIGHRTQQISDHVVMITKAAEAANPLAKWHLIWHSTCSVLFAPCRK